MKIRSTEDEIKLSFTAFKEKVLEDYSLAVLSRECSILGRREVFSGKGKFGIFGDGKELPQLALNHFLKMETTVQAITEIKRCFLPKAYSRSQIYFLPFMLI